MSFDPRPISGNWIPDGLMAFHMERGDELLQDL
jgi:hypothetical protein